MPANQFLIAGMARSYIVLGLFAGITRKEYAVVVRG
jgi:hypothetical protein